MFAKLFTKKPEIKADKSNEIEFLHNVFTLLSSDLTMSNEEKQQVLLGALICTKLTIEDVRSEMAKPYRP